MAHLFDYLQCLRQVEFDRTSQIRNALLESTRSSILVQEAVLAVSSII